MNRVELTGNLADCPSERRLPSGTRVANARLAQSYTYDTKDGARQHTNWFSLAFYGEMAIAAMKCDKGDRINVVGTIEQRQFTPKDGSTRTVYEVIVKDCRLVAKSQSSLEMIQNTRPDHLLTDTLLNAPSSPRAEEVDAWAFL